MTISRDARELTRVSFPLYDGFCRQVYFLSSILKTYICPLSSNLATLNYSQIVPATNKLFQQRYCIVFHNRIPTVLQFIFSILMNYQHVTYIILSEITQTNLLFASNLILFVSRFSKLNLLRLNFDTAVIYFQFRYFLDTFKFNTTTSTSPSTIITKIIYHFPFVIFSIPFYLISCKIVS